LAPPNGVLFIAHSAVFSGCVGRRGNMPLGAALNLYDDMRVATVCLVGLRHVPPRDTRGEMVDEL